MGYGSNGKSPPSPSMVRNGNGSSPKHSGSQLQLAISTKTPHPQTPNCAVTPSPSAEQRYNYSNSVALNLSSPRAKRMNQSKGLYADLRPFQTKATRLYEKYIAPGSKYEINISYGMRNAFTRMLGDEKIWSTLFVQSGRNRNKLRNEKIISDNLHRILKLFKESIDAMIKLCAQSFTRFKREYAANLEKYMV